MMAALPEALPEALQARFVAPQHAGSLAGDFDAIHVGEAGEVAQGTWIRLQLGLRGDRVAQVRFAAYGCPWTIAACDWLAGRLEGLPWSVAAGEVAGAQGSGGALDWARDLAIPEARLTRLLVLEDALRAAWQSRPATTG